MSGNILVSASRLHDLLATGDCTVVDCRFDLEHAGQGRMDWLSGHIPGALYAHLDDDLASPIEDHTGRHPLPVTEVFAGYLASIGWNSEKMLVAYDAASGAYAARLWWLMRYYGKPAALLDGGLAAWQEAGFGLETGVVRVEPTRVEKLEADEKMMVTTAALQTGIREQTILDARATERFSGEVENLDTRAGHIPGAFNRPFTDNLTVDSRFKPAAELRQEYDSLLRGRSTVSVVHSCGSGVTACHNLFAMELADMGSTRLYPGSWSEWIRDPSRPIETGV